jgi:hypothetical protein
MKLTLLFVFAALLAVPASAEDLTVTRKPNQWKLNNINKTSLIWHVQKPVASTPNGIEFSFLDQADDWYSLYLKTNYNEDLTDKTITATIAVTSSADTSFWTRSTACENDGNDAYVRLEFQSTTSGTFSSNDYWWSTGENSLNLFNLAESSAEGILSFRTSGDRGAWSNICGKGADDTTVYTGPDCVGGVYPAVSPYDGFTAALKNVKLIGVAFGSSCRYASGVAVTGTDGGTFQLRSYTIEP